MKYNEHEQKCFSINLLSLLIYATHLAYDESVIYIKTKTLSTDYTYVPRLLDIHINH